jgi:hypothetical protein
MKLAAIALSLLCGVGCFTQQFHVETDPPGAEVWIGGKYKGTTPLDCKVTAPNAFSRPLEVKAKKDGYLPKVAFTDWSVNPLSRQWNQTDYYLKLDKLEPPPAPKPGE